MSEEDDRDVNFVFGLVAAVMLVMAACLLLALALGWGGDTARADCVARGGREAKVNGGKGGWVCVEPAERAP